MKYSGIIVAMITLLSSGFQCTSSDEKNKQEVLTQAELIEFVSSSSLDKDLIEKVLTEISLSPHPMGSDRQKQLADYLVSQGQALGLEMSLDSFDAVVPNPVLLSQPDAPASLTLDKKAYNVIGRLGPQKSCTIILASHYDSKYFGSFTYRGANDSGSSSAALLALAKALQQWEGLSNAPCSYHLVWFDGEEAYLPNWDDGLTRHPAKSVDNTYGSRSLASRLKTCGSYFCMPDKLGGAELRSLILLDMIGSPNAKLSLDSNSSKELLDQAMQIDRELGFQLFGTFSSPISDDHVPFQKLGIPVINLIDFHNLHFWHKPGDDLENIDYGSIEKITRLALALSIHAQP